MRRPQAVVPESVMPSYKFLEGAEINGAKLQQHMRGLTKVGVPYTDADIAEAPAEVDGKDEMDAIIAYLQVLGTMVKFEEGVEYRK
jgi:cytochrome c oxidase cbb3-type subunit 2